MGFELNGASFSSGSGTQQMSDLRQVFCFLSAMKPPITRGIITLNCKDKNNLLKTLAISLVYWIAKAV